MNFRAIDEHTVGISLDETTTEKDLADILAGLQWRAALLTSTWRTGRGS